MRLSTSFRFAILACAAAFGIDAARVAVAQPYTNQSFAGQQFSGQYPHVAPAQSSSGPGYYAAAMQASSRPQGPMSPPPSMPRNYPATPPQMQTQMPAQMQAPRQMQQPAQAPSGPLSGLKSSLGRFANPATPPVPPMPMSAPQPMARQQAWINQAATAPIGSASNPAYVNQTVGYSAPASPYAQYAASVAARASYTPNQNNAASNQVAYNAPSYNSPSYNTATPNYAAMNAAAQNRGPGYGASSLMANNQPTLAPGFAAGSAPAMSAAPTQGYSGPNYSGPTMAPAAGNGFAGAPTYDAAGQSAYGAPGMPGAPNSSIWQQPAMPDPVSTGNFGSPYGNQYGDPNFMPQGSAGCDPQVDYFEPVAPSCGPWFASVSGLIMTRDVPNNVGLAYQGAEPFQPSILNTETAGFDWSGGVEAKIGRMIGDRWALEMVYWWVDPSNGYLSARSDANDINSRLDMSQVLYEGTPLSDIFMNSHEQRVYRADSFQNLEINLLQQALVVDPANRFGIAYFTGARYFRYREILEYYAVQAGAEFSDNDFATQSAYHIRMRNSLIGWQLGARGHMYLGQRLRLYATPRFGLFANAISQQQDLCMVINLHNTKTDVAVLGQLDLGASLQVFRCCSIFAGYRVMGIAGVANADDQIARTFDSQADMQQINSSGSIILHGVNTGVQFQF